MQKEYKIIEVKLCDAETKMNDMAKYGWEVVSTDVFPSGTAISKAKTPMLITFSKGVQIEE